MAIACTTLLHDCATYRTAGRRDRNSCRRAGYPPRIGRTRRLRAASLAWRDHSPHSSVAAFSASALVDTESQCPAACARNRERSRHREPPATEASDTCVRPASGLSCHSGSQYISRLGVNTNRQCSMVCEIQMAPVGPATIERAISPRPRPQQVTTTRRRRASRDCGRSADAACHYARQMQFEVWYVRDLSHWRDIAIPLKAVPAVILRRGTH